MKANCFFLPGNWFMRNTLIAGDQGKLTVKISADPHDYQKTFCMKLRFGGYDGDWLLGNSYVKFRIWFDGRFIACGPFRSLVNGKRMEHTFIIDGVAPGKHTLAIASRCDHQGLSVEVDGGTLGDWKSFESNNFYAPVCWEFPAVYGYFKGDIGPGEYFEHLRGDLYPDNWNQPSFDDSAWQTPETKTIECDTETAPFDFEYESVHPVSIHRCTDGRFIADFGVERIASLQLTGPEKGGNVEIRLGEELKDSERVLYQMRSHVCYQEIWKFKPGRQTLEHFGLRAFRYAEIVNYGETLDLEDISILAVRAPYQAASKLICSNENIRKVWQLCENTIRNITCDTFVDCFTRERVAYEADALLTIGSFFTFNQNSVIARRHLPYQLNHPTWPCEWSQIIPLLYFEYYMETADKTVVAENFDKLLAYSSYRDRIQNGMIEKFDLEVLIDWPTAYRNRYDIGDKRFLSVPNMLACKSMGVLAYLAKEIGRDALAGELSALHEQMKCAINAGCFDKSCGLYADRPGSANHSLYANMWALYTDIVPEKHQRKVADFVAEYGMDCSLYSGFYYLDVLFRYGHGQKAFEYIAKADSKWQEMINAGCTVTTEYWIGDVPMMSLAHPWGSYPAHFIAKYVFGVRPTLPGWKEYEIKPDESIKFEGELQMIRNNVEIICKR